MATVRELEVQIEELKSALERSRENQRVLLNQINGLGNGNAAALRQQYEALLSRRTSEMTAACETRLNALREEMARLERNRRQEIRRAMEEAGREQKRLLEQLEEKNRELQDIIDGIRQSQRSKDRAAWTVANDLLRRARQSETRLASVPYDFFFPNQISIIREHLSRAAELAGKQMYEAAAATAEAAGTELELLRVKSEQKLREWEELFTAYREMVEGLHTQMEGLERMELVTEAGSFRMGERELDYWSGARYRPLKERIEQLYLEISGIEESGIVSYLQGRQPKTLYALDRELDSTEELQTLLDAVEFCVRSERLHSDSRFVQGQRIIDTLEQYGYEPVEAGFYIADGREDPKDCYEIHYRQGRDELRITMVPVRHRGVCEEERCLIRWDVRTVPDPEVIRGVSEATRNRLAAMVPPLTAPVQIVSGERAETFTARIEQLRQRLDPELWASMLGAN